MVPTTFIGKLITFPAMMFGVLVRDQRLRFGIESVGTLLTRAIFRINSLLRCHQSSLVETSP